MATMIEQVTDLLMKGIVKQREDAYAGDSAFINHIDTDSGATDVCLDGYFDLEALAEDVVEGLGL